jgi:hypothetical protein
MAASSVSLRPVTRQAGDEPSTTRLRATRLSDRAVVDTIERRAADVGLEGSFAGHSLRSEFATEGYAQKAIGTRHRAPRPLEVGKCDVWLFG